LSDANNVDQITDFAPADDTMKLEGSVFTAFAFAGAPQGLKLDSANSFANLVNVNSNEVPSLKRVKPGDDSNSYIVHKIEGTQEVGARMPLNSTPLSNANISLIRRWIVEGAHNSDSATVPPIDPGY
jgi:hypothetical protein